MKRIIEIYKGVSRHKINYDKANIYFSNTTQWKELEIAYILQFQIGSLLATYLGMPLFEGIVQRYFLNRPMDWLDKKLIWWKSALLIMDKKIKHAKASL